MTLKRKMRFYRKLSIVVLFSMVFQIVTPTVSWALTSGPTQPEFSSFEPVVTNNMVDPFTGDFTYNLPVLNIPGANGGGYALSLSYHSGSGAEHESSWVGFGWTLNPGAINRSKQGFPDDWENEKVTYWNKSKPSVTLAYGVKGGIETFSIGDLGGSLGVTYNNYKGWGYLASVGLSLAHGCVNLGYNVSDGEGSFSLSVSPIHSYSENEKNNTTEKKIAKEEQKIEDKTAKNLNRMIRLQNRQHDMQKATSSFSSSSYGLYSRPTSYSADNSSAFTGFNFDISLAAGIAPIPVPVFPEGGMFLRLSTQWAKQENGTEKGKFDRDVSGYMYPNTSNLMDYHTERLDGDLKMKDRYLGIPFNNADSYAVTGEGISGGFRLYQNQIGDFKPISSYSEIFNLDGELEGEAGLDNGVGWSVGAGIQTITQGAWGTLSSFLPSDRNHRFFRFANDLGGSVLYADNQMQKASIGSDNLPNSSAIAKEIAHNYATTKRNAASSFIAYNSNSEINQDKNGVKYKAYGKGSYIKGSNNITRQNNNQVGEFSITNESGMNYTYALPAHSKKEKDLNIEVKKNDVNYSTNRAHKTVFSGSTVNTGLKTIQGEEREASYATSYLLTSITTSDYIDRTNNGPTDDDFGGYTRFVYEKLWDDYKWRSPYTGFNVNRNMLYTTNDDMGFASMGEKEIYLLDYIETKTHIAIFHKSNRVDAFEAAANNQADRNENIKGTRTLKKLDRVELYFKKDVNIDRATNTYTFNSGAKPLKVVNFKYNYSLVNGIPNGTNGNGKLTLEKVWFDYEGTYEAKISPYEFVYNYPDITNYPNKYKSGGDDEITLPTNSTDENPNYVENASDPWGGYRLDGSQRHMDMESWLDQTKTEANFDPAAWQLKQIKLPSGGEIHIHYEQDDYSYVQDKLAHVMANIATPIPGAFDYNQTGKTQFYKYNKSTSSFESSQSSVKQNRIFFINEESIGLDQNNLHDLADELYKIYIEGNEKIYWRFLYSLEGETSANIGECDGEFITGYANVKEIGIAKFNNTDPHRVFVRVGGDGDSDVDVPVKVCRDFRQANTLAIKKDCSGGSLFSGLESGTTPTPDEAFKIAREFFNEAKNFALSLDRNCKVINPQHSFLRVPIVKHAKAKRGGGLRVKRLLMFDNTLGTSELYGSEYLYKTLDDEGRIISSGVASNEPASMREENALVSYLPRKNFGVNGAIRAIFAGRDKDQFEGPLGESMLPSPSVGYSKVIIRNIHSGETNTGFNVHEFYTYKDAPFKAEASELIPGSTTKEDYLPIYTGVFNYVKRYMYAVQGYLFKSYNFNGRPKKIATYSGSYDINTMLLPEEHSLVSSQEFEYFGMRNGSVDDNDMALPVMTDLQTIARKPLGVEVDLAMESRSVEEFYDHASISFDVSVGLFGIVIIPYATFFPTATTMEGGLKTHVTSKVINYPAVVKSTKSYQDGIYHLTENVAFNERSGQPIVTRTWDSYNKFDKATASNLDVNGNSHNGAYTQYNMPAHWTYPNFEQKAANERYIARNLGGTLKYNASANPKYTLEFHVSCGEDLAYTTGDLIQLNGSHLFNIYTIDIVGSTAKLGLLSTYYDPGPQAQIGVNTLEVIRSGRNNMVNENISSFTTYGQTGITGCGNCPQIGGYNYHTDAEYQRRIDFVSDINQKLNEAKSTNSTVIYEIPSGLIKKIGSDCLEGNSYIFEISPSGNINLKERSVVFPKNWNLDQYEGSFEHEITGGGYAGYSVATVIPENCQNLEDYWCTRESDCNLKIKNWQTAFSPVWYLNKTGSAQQSTYTFIDDHNAQLIYYRTSNNELVSTDLIFQNINWDVDGTYRFEIDYSIGEFELATNNSIELNFYAALVDKNTFSTYDFCNNYPVENLLNPNIIGNKLIFKGSQNGNVRYHSAVRTIATGSVDLFSSFFNSRESTLVLFPHIRPTTNQENANVGVDVHLNSIRIFRDNSLCSFQLPHNGLVLNETNGEVIGLPECCIDFCNELEVTPRISNVISASASNLGDNWGYNRAAYDVALSSSERNFPFNLYELAQKGKWRTESTHAYRVPQEKKLANPFNPNTLAYEQYNLSTGTFTMDLFSWDDPNGTKNDPRKWLRMNRILRMSPNGNALEEENVIGIKSAAKFGYDKSVPYLVAQNAANGTVVFESFEREYGTGVFEDNVYIPSGAQDVQTRTDYNHSGNRSLFVESGQNFLETKFALTNEVKAVGYQIKLWAKSTGGGTGGLFASINNGTQTTSFNLISRSGEWELYEATFTPTQLTTIGSNPTITLVNIGASMYIDDVRTQPMDAEMVCYVYDTKTLRLLASFDDQHFGLYYQYDAEGKLVRKLIETERGIKTISETQYNTKVQQRPQD